MHTATLFLELGAVILGLATLARLAGRVGLSPIPLYLLVGLAFGRGGALPLVTAQEFIEVGAQIGIILLLLMLGLDFSAEELTHAMTASAPAGFADLVLNFTPGFVAGLLLGWSPLPSLFLGGVTYISSSGIVAKMLGDLGWVANLETPAILSILVFEDLAMVLYLPLIAALLVGGGAMTALASVGFAVGIMLVTLLVALRFGPQMSRLIFSESDEALLLTIVGLTLLVAGVAEEVQASAAVGAFLVGIGISGPAATTARPLLRPVRDLFAVVFFFFFGLEIDPALIPPVLPVAVGLAVITGATKLVTGWFAGRHAGVGPRARRRAGAALIARGEFSIIIAGFATTAGLEPRLGPLAAAYVLILAVGGPLFAKVIDVRGEAARDRERRQREEEERLNRERERREFFRRLEDDQGWPLW